MRIRGETAAEFLQIPLERRVLLRARGHERRGEPQKQHDRHTNAQEVGEHQPPEDEISGCRVQPRRRVGELQRLVDQHHRNEDNAGDGAKNGDLA